MSEFTAKEKKVIDETVNYYLAIDEIRLSAKEKVDTFMEELADYASKNWAEFAKKPKAVIRAFIYKWIKGNKELLKDTGTITQNFADKIL